MKFLGVVRLRNKNIRVYTRKWTISYYCKNICGDPLFSTKALKQIVKFKEKKNETFQTRPDIIESSSKLR